MPTSPNLDTEVTYISGVDSSGKIAGTAFATWNGDSPATYTASSDLAKWGGSTPGTAGGIIPYYFDPASNWTTAEQAVFTAGFDLWAAETNISFQLVTTVPANGITIARGNDGSAYEQAGYGSTAGGVIGSSKTWTFANSTISIDTSVAGFGPIDGSFTSYGGYPMMTMLHEIGHAIGLGHGGSYNDGDGGATFNSRQYSAYDSELYSIMSYIDPASTSAAYYGQYPVTGTNWGYHYDGTYIWPNEPTTMMPLDILAAQRLYGTPTATPLSGGQTFGFNESGFSGAAGLAIAPFFDFTKNTSPVVTLFDMGTGNTLDLTGFATASIVNLNPGTYSSAGTALNKFLQTISMTNNIAIAYNTAIDTLRLGAGNDTAICNNDGDTIYCGAGNDTVYSGAGNDIIDGGPGTDTVFYSGTHDAYSVKLSGTAYIVSGSQGTDTLFNEENLHFSDGTYAIASLAHGAAVHNDFDGDGKSDLLWQSPSHDYVEWLMNDAAVAATASLGNVSAIWSVAGTGDFNADGKSDILWHNRNGVFEIDDSNGSGFTTLGTLGSSSWSVAAIGKFNDDDTSDILLQSPTGTYAAWLINGATVTRSSSLGSVSAAWSVAGTGDFDGNGKSEILWHNATNGAIEIDSITSSGFSNLGTVGYLDNIWSVAATGDFDGDGKDDILWQSTGHNYALWLMNAGGVTSKLNLGSVSAAWLAAGPGDFNADAKANILWHNTNGATEIDDILIPGFRNLGASDSTNSSLAAVGDFDGDGKTDSLWQDATHTYSEWVMNGRTVTSMKNLGSVSAAWSVAGAGNFYGDGKSEILWHNSNGTIEIDGMGAAGFTTLGKLGSSAWSVVAIGDFNGDGKSDILLQSSSNAYAEWLMNGATVASSTSLGNVSPSWSLAGKGDFNGDGKTDILWHNTASGDVEIDGIAGTGFNNFGIAGNLDSNWSAAAIGDFNGDGKTDILWQNTSHDYLLWLMDGSMVASSVNLGSVSSSWSVAGTGNFFGDGKSEILWHNTNGATEIDGISTPGFNNLGNPGSNSWTLAAGQ